MTIIFILLIGGILCIGFSKPLATIFCRIGKQSWSRTPFANSELINFLYGEKVTRSCFILIGIVWIFLSASILYELQLFNEKSNQKIEPIVTTPVESDEASFCNTRYENREWMIEYKGRKITVRACLVKAEGDKVQLKSEASGATKSFQRTRLSEADIKYLNSIGE